MTGMPSDWSSGAGPSPESCSSCGELKVPEATITSTFDFARRLSLPVKYSMPTARRPSNRMRVASASGTTARFVRQRAGLR
jgi:hypothetical protein